MSTRRSAKPPALPTLPLANPWLAIVLAWFIPGAGHFYLQRKGRGLFFFVLVVSTFVFGLSLGGHLPWQYEGSPLFILASIGTLGGGLPVLIAKFLGLSGEITGAGFEYGRAFIITAGLMNWMLVLDTWDIAWGKELESEDDGEAEPADSEEAPDSKASQDRGDKKEAAKKEAVEKEAGEKEAGGKKEPTKKKKRSRK